MQTSTKKAEEDLSTLFLKVSLELAERQARLEEIRIARRKLRRHGVPGPPGQLPRR